MSETLYLGPNVCLMKSSSIYVLKDDKKVSVFWQEIRTISPH